MRYKNCFGKKKISNKNESPYIGGVLVTVVHGKLKYTRNDHKIYRPIQTRERGEKARATKRKPLI